MCLEYISFVQATSAANVDGESRRITALYTEDTYMSHPKQPTETGSIPLIAEAPKLAYKNPRSALVARSARPDICALTGLLDKLSASQLFIRAQFPVPDSKLLHGTSGEI